MTRRPRSARATYEAFAPVYDQFNHNYRYDLWTGNLLAAAEASGLSDGRRLLDIGCGTGLSFLPMLERGWTVTACDISPAMLVAASEKVESPTVELLVADMRDLPMVRGDFDLIWAVNDTMNYLFDQSELIATLAGMARNLASDGRVVFDVNTLLAYESFFNGDHDVGTDSGVLRWRGMTKTDALVPGALIEARLETESAGATHVHCQRHFRRPDVLAAIDSVGLECLRVLGEADGVLSDGLDETMHTKAVYVCRHAAGLSGEGRCQAA
jgi:SAM-dependent methyltransferase